jgi:hypothetical protein
VARADASRLPLRSDGLTVDEDVLEPRILGILEPRAPGAGRYLGGMRRTLVVR